LHGTVDSLEAAVTGKPREDLFEARCRYYAEYLSNHYSLGTDLRLAGRA
jgi:hypothetical protein